MNWRETRHGVTVPAPTLPSPWLLAVLLFGVGDLATTGVGLAVPGVVEADPVARSLLDRFGVGALLGLKVLAFAVCYGLWRATPVPYRRGVPIGLACLGAVVTAWNALVVTTALHP